MTEMYEPAELPHDAPLFWEDKEVMESKTVGDTEYTRAYIRGTEQDAVWATRGSGAIEEVSSELSASEVYKSLTSPEAPTELGDQMQFEQELQSEVPTWADREVEIDHLLREYPDQLDTAREEFENGTLDQAEYDARISELEHFKQSLVDELQTYELRGPQEHDAPGEGQKPEPSPEPAIDDDFDIDM